MNQLTAGPEVIQVTVEEEMRRSYLDYAMSVIVSRAIPDVRDGLKPVHRRILYAMRELGYEYNKPHRKSANIVGETLGRYHPHNPDAIYEAMVRLAQPFSMRVMLVDGQGNFGSMDGDPPAAMRYTEARLTRVSHYLLEDLDKETVDFQPNYDESTTMPSVLPARLPNLIINGAGGIAVGMATNIPTHNLGEVIDACCALVDNPDLTVEDLMSLYIPGPDFPTGGVIIGRRGIYDGYRTGRGSVALRGRCHIEDIKKDRQAIIITEVPYQVNKARLIEKIAELVNNKELEGISDLRDESDREGVRVVVELKRDAVAEVVLNRLYSMTQLQTSFGMNMLVLHGGKPLQMGLKDILMAFLQFREEVIVRRTRFELRKARERAHVLIGLALSVANLDEMIVLIRKAKDPQEAREEMLSRLWKLDFVSDFLGLIEEEIPETEGYYRLSEAQARAILDLRLHRLTGLEREKLVGELYSIVDEIKAHLSLLSSRTKLLTLLKDELLEMKTLFDTPRRTTLEDGELTADEEDLIQKEDMVVTVSLNGYVKRVPLSTYRAQKRGGKGRTGMSTREEDCVSDVFVATTHTPIMFFSSLGKVYRMKTYKLPIGSPQSRGKALINLLPLSQDETISTILPLPEMDEGEVHLMFVTSHGNVRRNSLADFSNIPRQGKIAMKLEGDEKLISVQICRDDDDVLLNTRKGQAIRFDMSDVRQFASRSSTGVRGIRLQEGDAVVSMTMLKTTPYTPEERELYLKGDLKDDAKAQAMGQDEEFILTVSDRGFGKRTSAYAYRRANRGGQGVSSMDIQSRDSFMLSAFPVLETDQILLVTNTGRLIRCPVHDIRIAGRVTQGVRLFRIEEGEKVVSITRLQDADDETSEEDEGSEP